MALEPICEILLISGLAVSMLLPTTGILVATVLEKLRKTTTFLLAVFLWLHAIFFLNLHSSVLARAERLLYFTGSELVLFALLVLLSFLAASGFWKMLRSLAYIYFFPFVLCWRVLYFLVVSIRVVDRWFRRQTETPTGNSLLIQGTSPGPTTPLPTATTPSANLPKAPAKKPGLRFLLRPFRRFTLLWCLLLLFNTHRTVVWLCLIVVLVQLGLRIFFVLKTLLFSDVWLRKYGPLAFAGLNKSIETLEAFRPDAEITGEIKGLPGQIDLWKRILGFLQDHYLLTRWAWVVCVLLFGGIYLYFSALFSFVYYGIARVEGVPLPWPDAFVTSMFIPFFVTDLPKLLMMRIVGGIQCSLVVLIGIGTVLNFLQRRLEAVRTAAVHLSNRLAEQSIQEKYTILQARISPSKQAPEGGTKD
jgi:hypothetical protein